LGEEESMTRLYLPATLHQLAALERRRLLRVGDDAVIARGDSEETEYDALMTAAGSSAVLAAELAPGERRRVVVVAEVGRLGETGSLADVVAVHADADDLPLGVQPEDLEAPGWYATQEIPHLLEIES
jgi:hypothetical protein